MLKLSEMVGIVGLYGLDIAKGIGDAIDNHSEGNLAEAYVKIPFRLAEKGILATSHFSANYLSHMVSSVEQLLERR
jgi:hypothetical protein